MKLKELVQDFADNHKRGLAPNTKDYYETVVKCFDAYLSRPSVVAAPTTEKLTELNGRITVDREQTEDVARDFLEAEGLL